jgi:putative oxidoreductase
MPASDARFATGWPPLLARLLLAVIFFTSSIAKIGSWGANVEEIQSKHLPVPAVLLAVALAVELATWIGLVTGFQARTVAAAAFLYLIPVTLAYHSNMATQGQKNLGIMGGLLMVAAFGPGRFALQRKKDRPRSNR